MTNISDRISLLVKQKGISIRSLEQTIGCSNGVISRCINKGSDISSIWVSKIIEMYPDISPLWLLTGKGDITDSSQQKPIARHTEDPNKGIPLIPFSAMAGALTGETSILEYECERYIIPAFKGADFLMPIKGDSMTPTYRSGDIVACQRVPMSDLFFQWNRPYIINTNQGPLIKRIKPGSDKQHILIVSDNKEYDPFELAYEDIYNVALVIGTIRME